jgi:quercetin dioxygenase-like cupin family protein
MKVDDLEPRELIPGTSVRFVHGDRMTVAYWHFEPGIALPVHSHPHEQITNILSGEFELTVDGEPIRLQGGDYLVIAPGAVHSGRSITDCDILDVFCPVREDYR